MSSSKIAQYAKNSQILKPIDDLQEVGHRVTETLKEIHGIDVVGQLLFITERELLRTPNFSKISLKQLKAAIAPLNIDIGALSDLTITSHGDIRIPSIEEMQEIFLPKQAKRSDVNAELARLAPTPRSG